MVLTDASMPYIDGLKMVERIDKIIQAYREEESLVIKRPVIFMYSPFNVSYLQREAKGLKIDYVAEKPLDQKYLKQVLQKLGFIQQQIEEENDLSYY